jgi:hypothetical protein
MVPYRGRTKIEVSPTGGIDLFFTRGVAGPSFDLEMTDT